MCGQFILHYQYKFCENINFNRTGHIASCLQGFDAVGWVAGRASGL